jgi:hypothetical protein
MEASDADDKNLVEPNTDKLTQDETSIFAPKTKAYVFLFNCRVRCTDVL